MEIMLDPSLIHARQTDAVTSMQIYPLEEYLKETFLNNAWKPGLITKLLNELLPNNMVLENGVNGFCIVVQSVKHPFFVEDLIENFLKNYLQIIEEMLPEEFQRHKKALIVKKVEKPKTVYNQFNQFCNEIALALEADVALLRIITEPELIVLYKSFLGRR
uniref:Coenzyme PQQ synthesis protein F-like C-terminal lobe domain-containing protein n=1 Tax=Glossina palpalis gambiensis TaxID=67801 RepID=A0A1B0BPR9_9MUSC